MSVRDRSKNKKAIAPSPILSNAIALDENHTEQRSV
jgi:hypothetical protein